MSDGGNRREPPLLGAHNPRLRALRRLANRRAREESGRFLLDGLHLVEEALAANWPLEALYVAPELLGEAAWEGLRHRLPADLPVFRVAPERFRSVAPTETPQGVLAVAPIVTVPWEACCPPPLPLALYLDGVQDPGNVGALVRSAAAFGATGLIAGPGTGDPFHPRAARASMGALFRLPICRLASAEPILGAVRGGRLHLAVAEARGGMPPERVAWDRPLLLVLGSEGRGVSAAFREVGERVSIPLCGGSESLNVAAAGAILLYEAARCRREAGARCSPPPPMV